MVYVTLAAMLALVLHPVLIPLVITAVHAVNRLVRSYRPARTAISPIRVTSARMPVPAAA
jgi:ABC-type transport system involved in cytochrome c biogenesis permease component